MDYWISMYFMWDMLIAYIVVILEEEGKAGKILRPKALNLAAISKFLFLIEIETKNLRFFHSTW